MNDRYGDDLHLGNASASSGCSAATTAVDSASWPAHCADYTPNYSNCPAVVTRTGSLCVAGWTLSRDLETSGARSKRCSPAVLHCKTEALSPAAKAAARWRTGARGARSGNAPSLNSRFDPVAVEMAAVGETAAHRTGNPACESRRRMAGRTNSDAGRRTDHARTRMVPRIGRVVRRSYCCLGCRRDSDSARARRTASLCGARAPLVGV